jgi:arsenate reductase
MTPTSVLFVCVHNSARSQMAEAFLRSEGGGAYTAESAGIEPGTLNPTVVEVMQEAGIDISGARTKGVAELIASGAKFDLVITVCDETSAGRCPVVPGGGRRLHWSFEDPSSFTGSVQERKERTRAVRDAIRRAVHEFITRG